MSGPLATQVSLLIGPSLPLPAPPGLVESLKSVEVTHQDEGRSGFQITFQAGRSGPLDLVDYPLLKTPLLKPFNRVVLSVLFGGLPEVLMDGMITHQQLAPSNEPGATTLTVTGEDVSVMMDLKQNIQEWPAMPEPAIATALIGTYAQYGLVPAIVPPVSLDLPLPIQRTPMQIGTDLAYLKEMAGRFAYVFYVEPGPVPMMNTAYWGPPKRVGIPQRALSVNLGPESNVDQIGFSYNALAPNTVAFRVQDRDSETQFGMETFASTRIPLSLEPALLANQPNVRRVHLGAQEISTGSAESRRAAGLNIAQTIARAQAMTDTSTDNVVTASGTLDALRYGRLLKPRGLVGLRGVGLAYDGFYYVKSVGHSISKGEYKQRFTITRDGTTSQTPVVPT
jgi:hypothetical protein